MSYSKIMLDQRYRWWIQGRNRHIFLRGQSHFSWFFSGVKCFFPGESSHFGRPETTFRSFLKCKAKKKKVLTSFSDVFLLPFPIFHLFFSIFTPFPFFPCLIFPDTSAKISRSEVSGGHSAPCPPPVTPLDGLFSFIMQLIQLVDVLSVAVERWWFWLPG